MFFSLCGPGVEICYELYSPRIQKIEVLKLEKRLDDNLMYLRDALPEYSTVDPDMKPALLSPTGEVPVNKVRVSRCFYKKLGTNVASTNLSFFLNINIISLYHNS